MSEKADGNGGGDHAGVTRVPVPILTITFDPRTYSVAIGGNVPSWIFAEAILHMAVKEVERKIQERRVQSAIALADGDLTQFLKTRGA